jgi:hypothetical protein
VKKLFVHDSGGGLHTITEWHIHMDGAPQEILEAWVADDAGVPQQFWPPDTEEQIFTYNAIWAQSYSGTSLNNSSHRGQLNYQGESSYHGHESSLWGFDIAQIRADLASHPNITKVRARISNRWTYSSGGEYFYVMRHNHSTEPTTVQLGDIMVEPWLGRGETKTFDLPVSFGEALRDGSAAGIGLKYKIPGVNEWGYCTGMYSTKRLVASPSDSDIIACPENQITQISILAGP